MVKGALNDKAMTISTLNAQIEVHSSSKRSKALSKFTWKKVRKMKKRRRKVVSLILMWEKFLCLGESYTQWRALRRKTRKNTFVTHNAPSKAKYVA